MVENCEACNQDAGRDTVRRTAPAPVLTCRSCGRQVTNHEGEAARQAAVNAHLTAERPEEGELMAGDNPPLVDYPGLLTDEQMLAKFRAAIEACGSQKDWAEANGVSRQMVCDVLQGNRKVRGRIAAALGYRAVTRFEPIGGEE